MFRTVPLSIIRSFSLYNIMWLRLTTLPPFWAVVMKSGNLNFLEPSGPLRACNGAHLPLPLPFFNTSMLTLYVREIAEGR
jgi:hypothetical protein